MKSHLCLDDLADKGTLPALDECDVALHVLRVVEGAAAARGYGRDQPDSVVRLILEGHDVMLYDSSLIKSGLLPIPSQMRRG